jgi:branched-chain amino acid transport system substrate-binding protein
MLKSGKRPAVRRIAQTLGLGMAVLSLAGASPSLADGVTGTVKLGVLSDFSNIYSTSGGLGLIAGAKLAVEDFMKENPNPGFNVEIIYADHQQKADVGAAIAKQWFEKEGVDAVLDVTNSSVAFAVMDVVKQYNKVALLSAAGSARLTGELCTPNTIHWTYDTYEVGNAVAKAITAKGGDSWYFLTADYSFGKDLEAAAANAVVKSGGKVLGQVLHPVNTQDFSSFLLQAQSSGDQCQCRRHQGPRPRCGAGDDAGRAVLLGPERQHACVDEALQRDLQHVLSDAPSCRHVCLGASLPARSQGGGHARR